MDDQADDKTYSKGERAFLLFAGILGSIVFPLLTCGFVYFLFIYHGAYHIKTPWYRALMAIGMLAGFAVISARLAVEAYRGKVLD
jgi:hypothetical protein